MKKLIKKYEHKYSSPEAMIKGKEQHLKGIKGLMKLNPSLSSNSYMSIGEKEYIVTIEMYEDDGRKKS